MTDTCLRFSVVRGVRLAVAAALFSACAAPAPDPSVITVALWTSPNNLDPRFGTDDVSTRVHSLIFSSLLKLDENMRPGPGVATSWDTTDYRTYVLHLRQGVRFHDGHELTSRDVIHTFHTILDQNFGSPYRGAFRSLDAITALDPYTVRFTLTEPSRSFVLDLVAINVVPAGAGRELRDHPVGTGPYEFVSYAVDDHIELKAFRDYFDGAPRNAGLVLKVVPDDIMRGLELRKGTSDIVVNDLVPDIVYQLKEDERLRVVESPGTDYQYVGINLRDPALKDVRVRHALGYAIDRQAIVDYLRRGLATPADGMLPPSNWAYEPDVFTFTHDPARARRLLDEAGYLDPDGDGPLPRLSLSLKTTSAEFQRLQAAAIQQDLRKVGIHVDVRTYEFATLYADVLKGNFQTYILQWVGGAVADPDILRRVFHSQQVPPVGFNRGHFSDPEIDRLIDRAAASTDLEDRRRLYSKVQQLLAEAAPYISLWHKTNFALSKSDLEGIHLSPNADFGFLRNLHRRSTRSPSD